MTHRMSFDPVDTLFFRDGSPFHANEFQSDAKTLFPPSPYTVVGSVRAALARSLGWNGRSGHSNNWETTCAADLGSDDSLGPLSFVGPVVSQCDTYLFPAPCSLLGCSVVDNRHAAASDLVLLRPSNQRWQCDLGEARLPEPQRATGGDSEHGKSRKLLAPQWWVTREGLGQILDGNQKIDPNHLRHEIFLWKRERRIGITRNVVTRTTLASALYAPNHIRLNDRSDAVRLEMFVDGLDQTAGGQLDSARVHPLGGESRTAWIDIAVAPAGIDPLCPPVQTIDVVNQKVQYSVYVMTPLPIDGMPLPGDAAYLNLPGTVVSVCTARPQYWGGWNSRNNAPETLQPYLPAGSVLYMEAHESELDAIRRLHLSKLGDRDKAAWGFGLIAIGNWPAESVK